MASALLALCDVAGATEGDLDPTFGDGGIARVSVGSNQAVSQVQSMVRQADGKLVVAGQVRCGTVFQLYAFGLARFNVDGSLDATFGDGGTVTTGAGTSLVGTDLIQLANGKLAMVGYRQSGTDITVVARYLANGQLDTTFGTAGIARAPSALPRAITEQPDGKLVIAAHSSQSIDSDFVLIRLSADGLVDETFGSDGVVRTNVALDDRPEDVLVQPDGKIVIAGSTVPNSVYSDFALLRYQPDGALDPTFGDGGVVRTNIGTSSDVVHSLVRQPDGKLVAAGHATLTSNDPDFAFARYNADGSLDPSFGTGGVTTVKIVNAASDQAWDVVALADGGFAAAGLAGFADGTRFAVARMTAAGQPVAGFGTNGVVTTRPSAVYDLASAIVEQPDGRLVVAGVSGGVFADAALVRYLANGALDTSFGNAGVARTTFSLQCDWATAVAEQADGKLVVVGRAAGVGDDFGIARLSAGGAVDASFGTGGRVLTSLSAAEDLAHAVLVQPDGKVVVAGKYNLSTVDDDFALVRYQSSGALDTTFGTGGIVRTAMTTSHDDIRAMLRQPDGKLVVAGWSTTNSAFLLARYSASGVLDSTFGTGGKVSTGTGATSAAYALARQPDGKLVVAGESTGTGEPGTVIGLVRLNVNGTLDSSFGSGGRVNTSIDTGSETARALVLQPDGKPVVAGYALRNGTVELALVRYTTGGALDPTFGSGGVVTTHFDSGRAFGYGLTRQQDGKLVIAASIEKSTQVFDGALVRYLADGSLDTSFGDGGVMRNSSLLVTSDQGQNVLQTAAGALILVGQSLDATGSRQFTVGRVEVAVCGNGVREATEVCDEGTANGGASCCSAECSLRASGQVCRTATGGCDIDERCDGVASLCPSDAFVPAGTECRASAGACDPAESCSGTAGACPADVAPACTATATATPSITAAPPPTATLSPSATATASATATGTATSSRTETPTSTATASATATETATPSRTETGTSTATASATATETVTPSRTSTATASATPTATGTATSTATGTPTPTGTDTAISTAIASATPTLTDTPSPTVLPAGCPLHVREQCRAAGKSQILIRKGGTSRGDRLSWRWQRGAATDPSELGDPLHTTSYALCLYAGAAQALVPGWALRVPPDAARWRPLGSGFRYSDSRGTAAGVSVVLLRGSATSPTLMLKGKGDSLPDPALPLPALPLIVQWASDDPGAPCWESVFDAATVLDNDARKLALKTR